MCTIQLLLASNTPFIVLISKVHSHTGSRQDASGILTCNVLDQLVDPYTYVYNTAVFSTNGEYPVFYKDAYQTDVIHAKTKAALDRVHAQDDPFFLWGNLRFVC